jgi:hypothetical protein
MGPGSAPRRTSCWWTPTWTNCPPSWHAPRCTSCAATPRDETLQRAIDRASHHAGAACARWPAADALNGRHAGHRGAHAQSTPWSSARTRARGAAAQKGRLRPRRLRGPLRRAGREPGAAEPGVRDIVADLSTGEGQQLYPTPVQDRPAPGWPRCSRRQCSRGTCCWACSGRQQPPEPGARPAGRRRPAITMGASRLQLR